MASSINIEPLVAADWDALCGIYAQGIATGLATFETAPPTWEEWNQLHHPFGRLAARRNGELAGFASLSPVSRRACYAGVAEASVYVAERHRGCGVGRLLLRGLIKAAEDNGIWTLQSATIAENVASLRLQESCGFRVVGRRDRIAKLDGAWRDTILMERRSPVA